MSPRWSKPASTDGRIGQNTDAWQEIPEIAAKLLYSPQITQNDAGGMEADGVRESLAWIRQTMTIESVRACVVK
jgi:hypothetical protein